MSWFDRVEQACAAFVERTFAKTFPSDLEPAQIARKLVAVMEARSRGEEGHLFAPGSYVVGMHGDDYERLEPLIAAAGDRYVALTAHNLLFSRLHKLRGFAATMEDFYLEPKCVNRLLDMIVDFKVRQCRELHRRFGDRIHGLFVADDWGTQAGPFIGQNLFDQFFAPRYRIIFDAIHACGWHVILHSCGRINRLVPSLIALGVDVLNMQQSRSYGLVEFGEEFRGRVSFLATVDIQTTMPRGIETEIREAARLLAQHWRTAEGGLIVFDYGAWEAIGVGPAAPRIMFDEFMRLQPTKE